MRWSHLYIPTLREMPGGAGRPGAGLLTRAGYRRDGVHLHLGSASMARLAANFSRRMAEAGSQPVATTQGLAGAMGGELRSYKQLPQGFHAAAGNRAEAWWVTMAGQPRRLADIVRMLLETCRLPWTMAESNGRSSFAVESEHGEQALVDSMLWEDAVTRPRAPETADPEQGTLEEFATPGKKTIADVSEFTGLPATSQIKSLVLVSDGKPVLALVRGDHRLNEKKLGAALGAKQLRAAAYDEILRWFGAGAGSLGPVGVSNIRVLADLALQGRRNMICGANRDDFHLRNVTPGEDFQVRFMDLRYAEQGDTNLAAGNEVVFRKVDVLGEIHGMEPGPLRILNEQGKQIAPVVTACVVNLDAALVAMAEQHGDALGLRLPAGAAPYDVIVTPVNMAEAAQSELAARLYEQCRNAGIAVLWDDREERAGVKFKDAELTGAPCRITVGKKAAAGVVEIQDRWRGQTQEAAAGEAIGTVKEMLDAN